jgi:integrase
MRAIVSVLIEMGFRLGETLKMRVSQFDALEGRISLPASHTKNKRAKYGYLDPTTAKMLSALCTGKQADDCIFTREDGRPVLDFRHAWRRVTERAGVPGILIHDLRRSAARLLRRAGVDRETIKKLAGWKGDGMFSRYSVDDDDDLRDVVRLRQLARQNRTVDAQLSSTALPEESGGSEPRVN